ncbi:efflux RND transporter periplasmic adaptor subunit [Rhodoblastus acidophilus]|uniref:Efflux RND transporter periplasmic adaptor subunit n=1 Tax=Candidatus Rhodoblastus alkanivorans TaxID=2954117 RepID=A0ABS9Z360_9HYPH|nr:efflux RND transporter periplasmic adaptor subunit [Candidatus Rhodoblastus alkanivorans]MCI4677364.1 efflux RND transporter periplasmic adaptor subunit [Candidatus Rhodoblastus alkanivorans]MCI4682099.1 efflux RND transporter periplasmic adaptor subunit [Candidatus Rhodoblastus alkanivorans]MDI4639401.1 efflux RND transporter periplasmic adaptor subunit [Rhodoblastus acidophilus]
MSPKARFAGALALVGGCALAAFAAPSLVSRLAFSAAAQMQDDPILFYRDPMGGAELSRSPKKDGMGMDFLPVRAADIAKLLPPIGAPAKAAPEAGHEKTAGKHILYYRNPMGLPDISPTPKKDSMGMDYVPVYEGEDQESSAITLSPGKVQRTGVRSEAAKLQAVVSGIRAPGTIQLDERRVTIVATRSTAFIEKVANVTTGDLVRKGQTLFRFYSPEIAAAAAQYFANRDYVGARMRLDVLNAPANFIAEIERSHKVPLSVDWPAPRDGLVFERTAVDGMKADAGQELFKIVDLSVVWALVDVSEQDYPRIRPGEAASIHVRGMPGRVFSGKVSLVYPKINRETRTARVRIELQNPDLVLRPDMYVDAEIAAGDGAKVVTVPESAVIDSGTKKLVLLDLGDGRFEPRQVKTGMHGEGMVEIRRGVSEGDKVVTSANFLIDAESNLKAAVKGLDPAEASK